MLPDTAHTVILKAAVSDINFTKPLCLLIVLSLYKTFYPITANGIFRKSDAISYKIYKTT